jgi:hypothetical protein
LTRRLLPLVLFLFATQAFAVDRPTMADLQKVLALHERSVVKVRGARKSGPGVIVGTEGQVLTSVSLVRLDSAQVEYAGQALPAKVVLANAYLKVAVVAAPAGDYPAVPVRTATDSPVGEWLIGVVPGRGRHSSDTPKAGLARKAPAPFFDVDLALPPGSPLFDTNGRLVAVSVQRKGRGCRALPLDVVRQQLATKVARP